MDFLVALSLLVLLAVPLMFVVSRHGEDSRFLTSMVMGALGIRTALAVAIYLFGWQEYFGGDANAYDDIGAELYRHWRLDVPLTHYGESRLDMGISGWGMYYLVAALYMVVGRNMLATQFLNVIAGTLVTYLMYVIAARVYRHEKVARVTLVLVAFFPSIVLWSSQGLKDALILLGICFVLLGALRLREGITISSVMLVFVGLVVVYALRFYVFYILAAALTFSMLMGSVKNVSGFMRQAFGLALIGGALLYLGVADQATEHLETIDLARIQMGREYLANAAESGFGGDIDIRSEGGLVQAMSIGLVYMLLAPFPWEMTNMRQLITLPEMLVWWSMMPLLFAGLMYSLKYRVSETAAISAFLAGLLLAYSLYLSNVGTAYRMRAQLLPFFFLFVAAGYTLRQVQRAQTAPKSRAGTAGIGLAGARGRATASGAAGSIPQS